MKNNRGWEHEPPVFSSNVESVIPLKMNYNHKPLLVFTPTNPLRPHHHKLIKLHRMNINQNNPGIFDYIEKECVLPTKQQKSGLKRCRNWVNQMNQVFKKEGKKYRYFCKWDDDMLMPPNILHTCIKRLEEDSAESPEGENALGIGCFHPDYGKSAMLMTHPEEAFYGAFHRFFIYHSDVWGIVPTLEQDPQQVFQTKIEGKKLILNDFHLHLDHRAIPESKEYIFYRLMLDFISFIWMKQE